MKAHLSKLTLIVMLIIIVLPCHSQQTSTVSFSYDANGNRIARQIEIGGTKGDVRRNETMAPAPVDNFEALSVTLYPNPTDGQFCIVVNKIGKDTALHAKLTTATGEGIYDKTIHNQTECFDLTKHPSGIYLLELIVASESHVWKVIKR